MIPIAELEREWKIVDRFFDKVVFYSDSTCWEWIGAKRRDGYGNFMINGKMIQAHRYSYELYNGTLIQGLVIDHLCRHTSCVNPDHLDQISRKENVLRGISPAAINYRKSHCNNGHPLSGDNLWVGKKGRRCKTCNMPDKQYKAEYYKKNKDRIAEKAVEYRKKNKDRIAEYKAEYYKKTKYR